MSVDYAAGLSHYDDLGVCGIDEIAEELDSVEKKVKTLATWLREFAGSCVVHVGAGLSTSAGIPDFRGKSGVWTKLLSKNQQQLANLEISPIKVESVNIKSDVSIKEDKTKPFDETEPTVSHLILKELCLTDFVRHIVSQNVDGLFLKSNLPRKYISELHGNFYLDECTVCRWRYVRTTASKTMRLQKSSVKCPRDDKPCKGCLRDTILDWESPIPFNELKVAQKEAKRNRLHICIGTSMQLRPSKDLVCNPKKNKSQKLVVINLQPTHLDKLADLVINYYADDVMKLLAHELDLNVPTYDISQDQTKRQQPVRVAWKRM